MNKTEFTIEPGKQELFITRTFDAPRALIFKAHTDPRMIPQWWGPGYLTTIIELLEPKAGGRWRFVQRDPQGNNHGFHGVFHHVSPERIVQTFEYEGAPGHVQLETMTLEEIDGRTKMTVHSVFQSVEARDAMVGAGMEGGFNEGMQRLDRLLLEAQARA
jgi:uncharacterized protein YndB with AHSA1/START domain